MRAPVAMALLSMLAAGCEDGVANDAGDASAAAEDAGVDAGDAGEAWWKTGWTVPGGPWPTCSTVTPTETLADKAAYYDWAAVQLHQVPESLRDRSTVWDATLSTAGPTTIVPASQLPTVQYQAAANDGLWTSLYIASQAFRYATTKEADALDNVRRTLRGTHDQMLVTGFPGLYARELRDPSIPGEGCPTDPMAYVPVGADRVGNQWVQLDANGCTQTYDPAADGGTGTWVTGSDCVGTEFAGRCWQRNVSRDEYDGHMFAAGVVARFVPDPEVQSLAQDVFHQVAHHLIDHAFAITDYDGLPTEYGAVYALSGNGFPGFYALLSLSWMRAAATVTGEAELEDTYLNCLLQQSGVHRCINQPTETPADYLTYLTTLPGIGLDLGCSSSYDAISMGMLAYLNLIWFEPDASRRAAYRAAFQKSTRGPDQDGRNIWAEANPFYNFILATAMEGTDVPSAHTLVEDGVCSLYSFPNDLYAHAHDNSGVAEGCPGEAAHPIPIDERCNDTFIWWRDPYQKQTCAENLTMANQPGAFLLPYWMGRYFGFISAGQ